MTARPLGRYDQWHGSFPPMRSTFVLTLLLTVTGAHAQTVRSSLEGRVLDETAQPVHGAAVGLSGDAFTGKTTTDAQGSFRFREIPAGTYTLTIETDGFDTVRDDIAVRIDSQRAITVTLRLAAFEESVDIVSGVDVADPPAAELKLHVDAESVAAMPLNGRNYLDLILLAPGVIVNTTARSDLSNVDTTGAILGERAGNIVYLMDGLTNTDDFRGGPLQVHSLDAIQELEIIETGWRAEFGGGSGGVVNVVTKRGTNELAGQGYFYLRDDALDASNIPGEPPPELARYNYGLTLGLPVARDRAWFFGSAEQIDETRGALFPSDLPEVLAVNEDFSKAPETAVTRLLGKLSAGLGDAHQLDAQASWTRESSSNAIATPASLPSAAVDDRATTFLTNVTLHSAATERTFFESSFGYRRQESSRNDELGVGHSKSVAFLDTGRAFDVGPRFDQARSLDQSYFVFRETVSWFPSTKHSVKSGVHLGHQRANGVDRSGLTSVIATVQPLFAIYGLDSFQILQGVRFPTTEASESRLRNTRFSAFVQDDWQVSDELLLNVGLRYDFDTAFDDSDSLAPRLGVVWALSESTALTASWGVFYDRYRLGVAQPVPAFGGFDGSMATEFNYPRLAADALLPLPGSLGALSATGNPFLLHEHFGISPGATLTRSNVAELTGFDEQRFLDELHAFLGALDMPFLPFGFSPTTGFLRQDLSAAFDETITVHDPIETPHNQTFTVGAEHRIADDWSARATYVHRELRNILGLRIPNLSPESRLVGAPVTMDGEPLRRSYGPWYEGTVDAFVASVTTRLAERAALNASYTYTRSRDNLLNANLGIGLSAQGGGAVPTDNLDLEHDRGSSDLTVPHRVIASGYVQIPFDIRVSGIVEATSGVHFSAAGTPVDVDGDGIFSTRPPETTRNEFRGPATFNLDVRIEKRFNVGERMSATLLAEGFNLTNAANPAAIDASFADGAPSPGFGTVLVRLPGREIQIGLRLSF